MKTIIILILIFLIKLINIITFSINSENQLSENTFIWQGFNHRWERKILNFLTPHRIGSIENRISNKLSIRNSSIAEISLKFTPGVNGDWAFPSTNFSYVKSYEEKNTSKYNEISRIRRKNLSNGKFSLLENFSLNYNNSSSETKFLSTYIKFNLSDSAKKTKHPFAETKFQGNFLIPKFDYEFPQSILNGFKINMKCLDEYCNSNGIWPSKILIDISKCKNIEPKSSFIQCEIFFEINRGYTPGKGGGKAFNYKMFYDVELNIVSIYQNSKEFIKIFDDYINITSNIHEEPIKLIREIQLNNTLMSKKIITGISAIGFELKKYKDYEDLGRYIQELKFGVGNTKLDNDNIHKITYQAVLGVNSSKYTTFYSDVDLILKTKTFVLEEHAKIYKDIKLNGKVCRDDFSTLFFCKNKNMENKQSDLILYEE